MVRAIQFNILMLLKFNFEKTALYAICIVFLKIMSFPILQKNLSVMFFMFLFDLLFYNCVHRELAETERCRFGFGKLLDGNRVWLCTAFCRISQSVSFFDFMQLISKNGVLKTPRVSVIDVTGVGVKVVDFV